MSALQKRSVTLSGHSTSIALEPEFWDGLEAMAALHRLSLPALMRRIDERRGERTLASACRVEVLAWARSAGTPPVY